jgi:DNA-directed RNA polymerase specialized sigma24 family protein
VTARSRDDLDFERLVVAASAGEESSWQELWRRLEPKLAAVLRKPSVLGPLSRLEDPVQDVLVAVMAKLRDDGFRRLRAYVEARRANPALSFLPWVTVVAKRAAIDRIRADPNYIDVRSNDGKRSGEWIQADGSLDDYKLAGARLPITNRVTARQILRIAGDALSAPQRRAVELWTEEASSEHIARELGLASAREAELLVRAGVERLRRRLRKDGE